jgi:hypothetical protein
MPCPVCRAHPEQPCAKQPLPLFRVHVLGPWHMQRIEAAIETAKAKVER